MHEFAKRVQTRCMEIGHRLDREHGLKAMPLILMLTIFAIPFMLIEMLTWTATVPQCEHRIDNRRQNYRKDPYCARCGKPLCTSRNENGASCMRERGHDGVHRNMNLKSQTEWRSTGSTLLNEVE